MQDSEPNTLPTELFWPYQWRHIGTLAAILPGSWRCEVNAKTDWLWVGIQWLGRVATLPDVWRYGVSVGTGWPSIGILWLGEVESLICNCYLSVAARIIVWADPSQIYINMNTKTESVTGSVLVYCDWVRYQAASAASTSACQHDCLIGLVVKAPTSRAKDPGFDSHLRHVDFSRSSDTNDLKIRTPVATLPGLRCLVLQGQRWDWLAQCQYSVTGWGRKFDLQLLSPCGSMYNCLSRSVPEIH